jgi:sulfonate transport system ATP-binding protein
MTGIPVSAQGLHKRFGKKGVLKGVNLEISSGEFLVIVGKSGSGKSTLLRLIAGLESASEGKVWINGQPLKKRNTAARVMFQDARLLPWKSVLQNVRLGADKGNSFPAQEALAQVGLLDRSGEWPTVLSGGERQRVALARALVSRPPLLLLDEPLGALDALTRIEMQFLIERLWQHQQFTAVLVTHDVEEAVALGDRIILIEEGRIAQDVAVDFPRPRVRGSAEFVALKQQILEHVLKDSTIAPNIIHEPHFSAGILPRPQEIL